MLSAAALADELDRYLQGEVIGATTLIPRLKRWNRREPELVARLGGLLLVALIAQFNYYFVSDTPDFWYHYTIQGVLAVWAASAVIFQVMMRAGWRHEVVRLLWSAADITFLTIEIKLFEKDGTPTGFGPAGRERRDHVARGLPALDRCVRALVAREPCLDHDRAGDLRLRLALCRRGARLAARASFWSPSPDLQHPNIFLAALLVTGYVVARQVRRILLLSQYYERRPPA